jgi:hypothetical protein
MSGFGGMADYGGGMDFSFDFGDLDIDGLGENPSTGEITGSGPLGALSEAGPMDMEALIFAVMSMRMNEVDQSIEQQIGNMKQRLAVKDLYRERIAELTRLIDGRTKGYVDPGEVDIRSLDYKLDDQGRATSFEEAPDTQIGSTTDEGHSGHIAVKDLKTEVERLQGTLDSLNSDSEIDMMRLNQYVSRRQQITTLFSNMMSNFHNTAMAAINNIK